MSQPDENWSRMKKLKHSLLKRAFNQNRGAEVILLIQWRLAQENHKNEGYVKLAKKFLEENGCQPRAIRALNLIAENMGLNTVYKDAAAEKSKPDIIARLREMKKEDQILLPDSPKKAETYLGTPEQFGIARISEAEEIYNNSRKPIGNQRDVRMEDLPPIIRNDQHGNLALLSAYKAPAGYKLN